MGPHADASSSQESGPAGTPPFGLVCAVLSGAERAQLLRWVRSATSPHRLVVRGRISLLASQGLSTTAIAGRLHVTPATVRRWCERFHRQGLAGIVRDAPGRGRRPGMTPVVLKAIVRAMLTDAAPQGRWTARTLAAHVGTSPSTVWRAWQRTGLSPESHPRDVRRALAQLETKRLP
jgi:transposase